jgi:hypothetical protein
MNWNSIKKKRLAVIGNACKLTRMVVVTHGMYLNSKEYFKVPLLITIQ